MITEWRETLWLSLYTMAANEVCACSRFVLRNGD